LRPEDEDLVEGKEDQESGEQAAEDGDAKAAADHPEYVTPTR